MLGTGEVTAVLDAFTSAAGGRLAGMDVVGDWSPVEVQGRFRTLLHRVEHPALSVDAAYARRVNQQVNLRLLAAHGAVPAAARMVG